MKTSTLRPGKTPDYVKRLREAANKELKKAPEGEHKAKKPVFDSDHKATPGNNASYDDFDSTNGVATYAGQNVEHIGNGTGGPR